MPDILRQLQRDRHRIHRDKTALTKRPLNLLPKKIKNAAITVEKGIVDFSIVFHLNATIPAGFCILLLASRRKIPLKSFPLQSEIIRFANLEKYRLHHQPYCSPIGQLPS